MLRECLELRPPPSVAAAAVVDAEAEEARRVDDTEAAEEELAGGDAEPVLADDRDGDEVVVGLEAEEDLAEEVLVGE
ncbi:Os04g0313550, partial [Oryza sativa Japonica Group]